MMKRYVLSAAFLLMSITASCTYNHGAVIEGRVYRIAQPMSEDIEHIIKRDKIATVLRLRGGSSTDFWVHETCNGTEAGGATLVMIPISAHSLPPKDELIKIVDTLENAPKPILIHCMAGADRTGLASAISVLLAGGTMERAREELDFWPHLHLRASKAIAMDQVLDLYEPWYGKIDFQTWVRDWYVAPEKGDYSPSLLEEQRKLASTWAATSQSQKPA